MTAHEPPQIKTPSIGRIVHWRPFNPRHYNHAEVLPAIIVRVWSDNVVNLKVFTDGHGEEYRASVELESEPGERGCWFWPPYVPPKTKEVIL